MSVQLTTTSIENYNPNNVKDNYNIINFKTNYTPTGSVNTHMSGKIDFYNKSQDGAEQVTGTITTQGLTSSLTGATRIDGMLKLTAYGRTGATANYLSYLHLNSTSSTLLAGATGIDFLAGSLNSTGKTIRFYADDGEYLYAHIDATRTRWYPDGITLAMTMHPEGLVIGSTSLPTAKLDVNSTTIRLRTANTPASATATGNQGTICWDANYIYVCVATNTWKRSALASW